jgi:hypothetical protein
MPTQALRHGQAARQSRWVIAIDRQWPFAGAIELSFNVITIMRDIAAACLERLSSPGDYRYNLSTGETPSLARAR